MLIEEAPAAEAAPEDKPADQAPAAEAAPEDKPADQEH